MPTQWCALHPQRHAFARCMTCAKTLCQECATQWDGIWHCAACLAAKRGAKVERAPLFSWIAVVVLTAICLFSGARLMVWAAAVLAGLLS
ncbi:MAG TPA: hypothetical protein VFO89_04300 [Thermoanaerobaculia bacterium]|nr:hypothetical protein [Thermoanaerobaculia bacterium]